MTRSTTERGLAMYDELTDTHGNSIHVQESSIAEGPCVWIFCHDGGFPEENAPPHLDIEQARRVRDALDAFIRENQPAEETR